MGRKLGPQGSSHWSGQDLIKTSPEEEKKRLKKRITGGDSSQLSYISITVLAVHISKITFQLVTFTSSIVYK
jgi:hypothetical protein